jgi:hypothetical protein
MRSTLPTRSARTPILLSLAGLACAASWGTTKGLNQIVTPDIQPAGVFSISPQYQSPRIGNKEEVQLELGITDRFEIAAFQGFSPSEEIFGAELGLIQKGPYLLSTGAVNYSTRSHRAQLFLEGGYYQGRDHIILGAIRVHPETDVVVGYARQLTDSLQVSVDYQGGGSSFKTAGFTYSISPRLSVNPAAYFTNAGPHRTYGYVVITYSIPLWKTAPEEKNPTPSAPPPKTRTDQTDTEIPAKR